jgi:hypothetical protein
MYSLQTCNKSLFSLSATVIDKATSAPPIGGSLKSTRTARLSLGSPRAAATGGFIRMSYQRAFLWRVGG